MPFTRPVLSAIALAVLAFNPVHAEAVQDASKVPGGIYNLDTRHTSVIWKVSHLGFSNFVGRFDSASGTLSFDPADPAKSSVDVKVDTGSLYTNVPDFAKELTGPEWINAAKGPITFKSTKITKTSETTGKIEGDLTLNGVTKPVVLDATFVGGGLNNFAQANAIGFSAKATIKRSDFGVNKLLPAIGDDVEIMVETEFQQKLPDKTNQ